MQMDTQQQHILIFAFRYALGRMSTAPSIVVDELIKNWDGIHENSQRMIKEEICHAIKHNMAGMDCDVKTWEKVLNL